MSDTESARPDKDLATWVREQWGKADLSLAQQRRDYWLNLAFIEGDQWTQWHSRSREVVPWTLWHDQGRVQATGNRMQPNLINLLAKLTKRELGFEVPATSVDDASLGGARLGEHLLEAARTDQGWERLRKDELLAAYLGGTSAVMVEWDPNRGEELGINPDTWEPVSEGDIVLSALSIVEFTLEPGTREWTDSRWFIACKSLPPAQVKEHFQLSWEPTADAQGSQGPMQRKLWASRGYDANVALTNVYTYYERPTKKSKGRWAVVVNDQAVVDKPWPFPFDTLNVYPFRQVQIPKRWHGHTLLNDARPLQVLYNAILSNMSEHAKLAGNARFALPDASGVEIDDLSDLPGEIVQYDGSSSAPPSWINPPNMPRWMPEYRDNLSLQIDDIMGVHAISRGTAPGDRNSGLALSVLAEQDDSPTGLLAHDQSAGWGYIATCILKMWEGKVPEMRTTTVGTDTGVPMEKKWTGKMLHGQTRATVPLDNVSPHSRAASVAQLTTIKQTFPEVFMQIAQNPTQMARMLEIQDFGRMTELVDADVAQAQRENMLMSSGQIPSVGDKPNPLPYEDHKKHIAEHNRARKQGAYLNGGPDVRKIFDLHILAHERAELEQMQQQAQMNQILPGSAAMPQAAEPTGSAVPPDFAEAPPAPPPMGSPPSPMPAGVS